MSAVAVMVEADMVVIASDGVGYDHEGIARAFVSKTVSLLRLNCAIASLGTAGVPHALTAQLDLGAYQSFDEVLAALVQESRQAFVTMAQYSGLATPTATIVIAGWSDERQRFEAYKVHSRRREMWNTVEAASIAAEPWTVQPIMGRWCSTAPAPEVLDRFGVDLGDPDAVSVAARLICAARATSGPSEPDPDTGCSVFAVGGFLQMTVLQCDQVQTWIAHRWPDQIGERLHPSVGEPMPRFLEK